MDRVHESPAGPPLIFEDESYQRSKQILGNSNGRNCGQLLSSGLWAPPFILHLFKFFFQFHATNIMGSFSLVKESPYLKGTGGVAVLLFFVFVLVKIEKKKEENGCV